MNVSLSSLNELVYIYNLSTIKKSDHNLFDDFTRYIRDFLSELEKQGLQIEINDMGIITMLTYADKRISYDTIITIK